MIPFGYQAYGTTSPTLLRGGGRRTQCPSGSHGPASVTAPFEPADSRSGGRSRDETVLPPVGFDPRPFPFREVLVEVELVRSKSEMRLAEGGRTFLKEAGSESACGPTRPSRQPR